MYIYKKTYKYFDMKKFLILGLIAVVAAVGGISLPQTAFYLKADTSVPITVVPKGELNITAKAAFLMEANSGKVLFSKDPTKHLPIASMAKIMTQALIYDALEE